MMELLKAVIKSKPALIALIVLAGLYSAALAAPFLAPYDYTGDDTDNVWAPPSCLHLLGIGEKTLGPHIHASTVSIGKYYRRVYVSDPARALPLRFFVKGSNYRIFGMVSYDRHLFGVDGAKVFLLGADSRGRDIFSRLLYGSRISLSIGLIGAGLAFLIGILVGSVSGYLGGRTDNVLMRLCEMLMMVPAFYLMLAMRASFPPSISSTQVYILMIVIMSLIGWASIARVIRGMAISLRENEFVCAAQSMGLGTFYIIRRHIIPHTVSYTIAAAALSIPDYILGEASLSLLGLGIQEPQASWGNMLTDAMGIVNIYLYPWILYPGLFIILTVAAFNVLGERLREVLDPKRPVLGN
jgi:peptide/nickel transport system permease protein